MNGIPFLEPFTLKTRRLYVLHTSQAVTEAAHGELIEFLHAQSSHTLDIVSLDLRDNMTLSQLFQLRDTLRSMPPEIRQRMVLAYGAGAEVSLVLNMLAALDEVYVIAPESTEQTEALQFDLALVGKAPVPATARRVVCSSFTGPKGRDLLAKIGNWSDCVAVPEDFRAELSDPRFADLVSQICVKDRISLPWGFIRLETAPA